MSRIALEMDMIRASKTTVVLTNSESVFAELEEICSDGPILMYTFKPVLWKEAMDIKDDFIFLGDNNVVRLYSRLYAKISYEKWFNENKITDTNGSEPK